jgi:hypothetical protein
MGILSWAGTHWFEVLQSIGIVAGFCLPSWVIYLDVKTRRADHRMEITKQHREIWTELYRRPELRRIKDTEANLEKQPVTPEEELFISFLIHHLSASYYAMEAGVLLAPDALQKDIQKFFSRPIIKLVWEKMEPMQDMAFVTFVENAVGTRHRI